MLEELIAELERSNDALEALLFGGFINGEGI